MAMDMRNIRTAEFGRQGDRTRIGLFSILCLTACLCLVSAVSSDEIDELIQTFDTDGWDDLSIPQKARAQLVEIGPKAVPALMKALNHENDRVRTWCDAVLMQIAQEGPKRSQEVTDQLLDDLYKVMRDDSADLNQRQIAVRLLARLGGQRSTKMLADSINDPSVSDYVVFFLGEKGVQALPYLQEAFTSAEPALKVMILQSVTKIGGDPALALLREAVEDEDVSVRSQAIRGIGQIGGLSEIALLEQMLKGDEVARVASADGLIALGDRLREAGDNENSKRAYLSAYSEVFNPAQVTALALRLRELGESLDVSKKFGSIYDWWIIGPFDNADGKGFDAEYPPEKEIVLTKIYESMGQQISWKRHHTEDILGIVDATKLFRPNNDVALYALAFVESPEEMDVQIRAGSDDTLSIWLNGKRIHHNNAARAVIFDEDKVEARLQKGVNSLLLKVCQGGGDWGFVARIVDKEGRPIPTLKTLSDQP